jgi:hypothetical protein
MIDRMVDRFLGWKLPANFGPDAGISFKPYLPQQTPDSPTWPTGTNLFTADQAHAMFKHAIGVDTTEQLCWAIRQFVRIVPAGDDDCWVRFKVGAQEYTIGSEPMPEDEAAHFAGLFVFAVAGAFKDVIAAVPEPIPPGECWAPNCHCDGVCIQRAPATFTRTDGVPVTSPTADPQRNEGGK